MTPSPSRCLRPRGALAILLALALALPGSWGCALFRDPTPPGFDKIAIEVEVAREKQGPVEGDLSAYTTLTGMFVGAATGAPALGLGGLGVGIAVGVLTCLPTIILYPICVFAFAGVGLIIGFGAGLFTGFTVGAIGGLPGETADAVTAALSDLESERTFDNDLMIAMREETLTLDCAPEQVQFPDDVCCLGRHIASAPIREAYPKIIDTALTEYPLHLDQ